MFSCVYKHSSKVTRVRAQCDGIYQARARGNRADRSLTALLNVRPLRRLADSCVIVRVRAGSAGNQRLEELF